MRYVRFEDIGFILSPSGDLSMKIPTHETIGNLVEKLGDRPISAGFVKFENGKPVCHGHSVSLGIRCREDDSEYLAAQLGID